MYTMESRVRFSETAADGILSIGGLIDYFQDVSTFHAQDVGMGPEYLMRDHRAWIINSWQVEIFGLPKLGDRILVDTWPYSFRKFIGNRCYTLRDAGGKVLARADSIWALYDMEKLFPAAMTEEEIKRYDTGPRLDMEERSRKIRPEGEFTECDSFTVTRDRLDANIHVNNGQYVKIGCNYIPEGREVSLMRVEYKTSMVKGDRVRVMTCDRGGLYYVRFDTPDGKEYACMEFGFKE